MNRENSKRPLPERAEVVQCVDKVPSHKKRAVILRNEVTKNPVDQLNAELFKILRLRFAPLRMTNSEFVYSLNGLCQHRQRPFAVFQFGGQARSKETKSKVPP